MKNRRYALVVGLVLCTLLMVVALAAPVLAPNDPYQVDMKQKLQEPSPQYPLGTDQLGRCVFSRLLYGAQTSLGVTGLVVVMTFLIGTAVGVLSGIFAGGIIDKCLTALCEIVLAFPGIILALVISGLLGPGILNVMLAVALVGWASFARMVRSLVIGMRHAQYIQAAKISGTRPVRIVTRHILPNISGTISTILVSDIGSTVLKIAGLSFIGLGAQPPEAEWGMMINEARLYISSTPSLILYPVAAVSVTVLAFHLVSDGLKGPGQGVSL